MSSANPRSAAELERFSYSLPSDLQKAVKDAQKKWDRSGNTERLWKKDASLWTDTGESDWLGWLDIVDRELGSVSRFKALQAEIREDGFRHVLLLGMGGSSLCPRVFSETFGKQPDSPELLVLDSTDPVQIRALRNRIDPARTLFCVSSKSGTTLEPNSYMQYFFGETRNVVGDCAGDHFIAVTDPDSRLEEVSKELRFRRLYRGVPGIGGRYSALSDFGLIPSAAMGLDNEKLLKQTAAMVDACKTQSAAQNPGVALGLVLGVAASSFGRDKVTLICSRSIFDLGGWLEQLLAESTGKQGSGLIPVDREPLFRAQTYGADRIFIYLRYAGDSDDEKESVIYHLEDSGAPVIRILLTDLYEIGQTFFQWEIATAVAGSILGINVFDQPDVEASKIVTRRLMAEFEENGSLPEEKPILEQGGIRLFADKANAEALLNGGNMLGAVIRRHLDRLNTGDYFGLMAYIPMFPEYEAKLEEMRGRVLEWKQVATVLGFGPRFLHSTGQVYKGGPNSGVFLQITCEESADVRIPGKKYTFGTVKAAQAGGDFQVLAERQRRLLRVHLCDDLAPGLDHLRDLICAAAAH